jgi:hypothetical protein
MRVPDAPDGITMEEWRRAVALLAATATHGENTTLSPVMRESNVLTSAKKFEVYLREGR